MSKIMITMPYDEDDCCLTKRLHIWIICGRLSTADGANKHGQLLTANHLHWGLDFRSTVLLMKYCSIEDMFANFKF